MGSDLPQSFFSMNAGGLLGLVFGVSVMSLFELLYWLAKLVSEVFRRKNTPQSPLEGAGDKMTTTSISSWLANSSLHGMKYLMGARSSTLSPTMIAWAFAIACSGMVAYQFISDLLGESLVIIENGQSSEGLSEIDVGIFRTP